MNNDNNLEPWVIEHEIQRIAYYKWLDAGCPNENSIDFWLEAEKEVWSRYGYITENGKK